MSAELFSPRAVYAPEDEAPPLAMIAPPRYIQGPGMLSNMGRYLSMLNSEKAGLVASRRGLADQGQQVIASLEAHGIASATSEYTGDCCRELIDAAAGELRNQQVDCVIALGGGKIVDAGKCIAHRLGVPVVIAPTLASNDAPCSALSVLYLPDGTKDRVENFPQNPSMVVVDTEVIAGAGERFLVAGMGDALATWYEARVCGDNPNARNAFGARPTLAARALGEICAATLFEHGEKAALAVREAQVNDSLEKVVEANTLHSGLGFESGGLAVAHAMALAYVAVPRVHDTYLHGEMVAMGLMTQLAFEGSDDAPKVGEFLARVGLPIQLEQLSLSPNSSAELETIAEVTLANPLAHNMPFPVNTETLLQAMLEADELGRAISHRVGDAAYRRIHG